MGYSKAKLKMHQSAVFSFSLGKQRRKKGRAGEDKREKGEALFFSPIFLFPSLSFFYPNTPAIPLEVAFLYTS